MAKRKSASYMTPGEQIAGTVFFVIYLVVLPFATAPLFRLAGILPRRDLTEILHRLHLGLIVSALYKMYTLRWKTFFTQ